MKIDLSKIFKYCPGCGANGPKARSKEKHIICSRCGFVLYHNAAAAAAAIIEYKKKVLLTVRGEEPKAGMLDFPGGFGDYGESAEETVRREVREELGIKIRELRYLTSAPNIYLFKGVKYPTIDMFFVCRTNNPEDIRVNPEEIAGIEFFEPGRIPLGRVAFESAREGIRYYRNHLRRIRRDAR